MVDVCVGDTGAATHVHTHAHLAVTPAARPPDFFSCREASEAAVVIIIALLSLISGALSQACRAAGEA